MPPPQPPLLQIELFWSASAFPHREDFCDPPPPAPALVIYSLTSNPRVIFARILQTKQKQPSVLSMGGSKGNPGFSKMPASSGKKLCSLGIYSAKNRLNLLGRDIIVKSDNVPLCISF